MPDTNVVTQPPHVAGYVLHEVIGRGASSVVWSATAEADGQRRAVKVTSPEAQPPDHVVDVAARETAILERVESEHIIRLHQAVPLEGGSVALVLDLADGGSLADLLAVRGRLTAGEAVTVFTPMASTLGALHRAGAVHSDVAPGNILFTRAGKPMLSDFDASRLVGEQHPHAVSGTPGFVAPEVSRGALPTEASDVYGLGAVAWYALSGTPLADGSVVTPEDAASALGPALGPVVAPLLGPDPEQRPTAAQAAVAFYRAAPATPVTLATGGDPASAMTRRLRAQAAAEPPPKVRRRRSVSGPVRIVLILLAAVVFTAVLVVLMKQQAPVPPVGPQQTVTASPPRPSTTASLTPQAELRADPQTVVQRLADARAAALTSLDKGKLLLADLEGSPAHTADVRLIDGMTNGQQKYTDLVYHVRFAQLVSGEGPSAQVLATVDRAVYHLVGPGTATQEVPAEEGRPLTYSLSLTDQGWRIADVK
jgi:hypothetical protein